MVSKLPSWELLSLVAGVGFVLAIGAGLLVSRYLRFRRKVEVFWQEMRLDR